MQLLRKFDNNDYDTHDLFEIHKLFMNKCNEQNIELDHSMSSGQYVGLPFSIHFIKK